MDFIKRLLQRFQAAKAPAPSANEPGKSSPENSIRPDGERIIIRPDDERIIRWRAALDAYGFPFRNVTYDGALEALEAEERLGKQEGFTPVFIVPSLNSKSLWRAATTSAAERVRGPEEQIRRGLDAEQGRAVLAAKFAQIARDHQDRGRYVDPALFDKVRDKVVRASEKAIAKTVPPGLSLLRQLNRSTWKFELVPEAAIMRIPTRERYAAPLYLDWGGWDAETPSSHELAAVARYWQETYGAALVAFSPHEIEFTVARKPTDHVEVVALLKEQYAFAPDMRWFDYNKRDLDLLEVDATELRLFNTWEFWW